MMNGSKYAKKAAKMGYAKGGVVKAGASCPPAQKSTPKSGKYGGKK